MRSPPEAALGIEASRSLGGRDRPRALEHPRHEHDAPGGRRTSCAPGRRVARGRRRAPTGASSARAGRAPQPSTKTRTPTCAPRARPSAATSNGPDLGERPSRRRGRRATLTRSALTASGSARSTASRRTTPEHARDGSRHDDAEPLRRRPCRPTPPTVATTTTAATTVSRVSGSRRCQAVGPGRPTDGGRPPVEVPRSGPTSGLASSATAAVGADRHGRRPRHGQQRLALREPRDRPPRDRADDEEHEEVGDDLVDRVRDEALAEHRGTDVRAGLAEGRDEQVGPRAGHAAEHDRRDRGRDEGGHDPGATPATTT